MSNRIGGLLVVLEQDVTEETFVEIQKALHLLKGVVKVTPISTSGYSEAIATMRERTRVQEKLLDLIKDLNL
jgi:hypothetical protein